MWLKQSSTRCLIPTLPTHYAAAGKRERAADILQQPLLRKHSLILTVKRRCLKIILSISRDIYWRTNLELRGSKLITDVFVLFLEFWFFLKKYLFGCMAHGIFIISCRILTLWLTDSLVAMLRLSCSAACGIYVPRPGIEPVSPALQGGFLTTGPPGKSLTQPF